MEIPSEMLYRNGIAMIAINAGMASVRSLKSILVTDVSIRNPTMITDGEHMTKYVNTSNIKKYVDEGL